jgi:hypothetical protein
MTNFSFRLPLFVRLDTYIVHNVNCIAGLLLKQSFDRKSATTLKISGNVIMYLHTNLQYKLIKFQSDISVQLGVLPFIWDPVTKKYKNDPKAFSWFVCTTISLYTFQYLFVLENILHHVIIHRSLPISGELFYSSIWMVLFTLQQMFLYLLYFKCDEFITLLNTFKFYTDYIAGKICYHTIDR